MAKSLKLNNLDELFKKIEQIVTAIPKESKVLNEVGQYVRDRIFKTTKSGKTMAFGTPRPIALLSLKPLTVKLRKWHQRANLPVGQGFSPGKSNLTYTGQMLDALDFNSKPIEKKTRVFFQPSLRNREGTGIRRKAGEPVKRLTNQEVAKQTAKAGRPVIGLDDIGIKAVLNIVKRSLREDIRKNRLSK